MIRKPHAAFGRVLYSNHYEAGYVAEAFTFADSKTILLFTKGSLTARDKQTGEVVHECVPGWISRGGYENRVFSCVSNVDSVSWCYDPKVNNDFVPTIEVLAVKQGESVALPEGTALFLCSGTLQINGAAYVAPRQISVRSAGTTATAAADVYGLIFI
jgi:hypothetical protein